MCGPSRFSEQDRAAEHLAVERHLLPFVVVLSRFQMEYSNFITKHGAQQCQFGPFEEVEKLRGKLPDGIVEFLTNEGMCSYADGFLFTVAPADYDEILSAWGVKGGVPSHGLRRMCLLLQEALHYLDPLEGRIVSLDNDPYLLMNYLLVLDAILILASSRTTIAPLQANARSSLRRKFWPSCLPSNREAASRTPRSSECR